MSEITITVNGGAVTVPVRLCEYDGTLQRSCENCEERLDDGEYPYYRGDYFCTETCLRHYWDNTWEEGVRRV